MNIRLQLNGTLLLLCLLALLSAGCKTSRFLSVGAKMGKPIIEEGHSLTAPQMVATLQHNQPAFQRANVRRMSVFVRYQERELNVKATCKMVSDSALHLSIQPFFGVELFKLEMTPTGMTLIDKANRRYYESNYAVFRNRWGITVNYDVVQSLISNRLFVAVKKAFLPDDFTWRKDKDNTLYVQSSSMTQEFSIHLALARISEIIMRTNDNVYSMRTTYDRFTDFGGLLFPAQIMIDGEDRKGGKVAFHFTIEDAVFDTPFTMEPTNLSRYVRGDIQAFFAK